MVVRTSWWLALVASWMIVGWPVAAEDSDARIEWLSDYAEALRLARQSGKPIFLEFRCAP